MSDLVAFLRARLDEDEVRGNNGAEHTYGHTDACSWWGDMSGYCDCGGRARVLREVETKRRILWLYEDGDAYERSVMEAAVEAMAAIYAEHPDYRDEWE